MSRVLKLALFGDPIEHSLSPAIHRRFGQQTGIELDYSAIRAGTSDFGPRFAAFLVAGGQGANLTVPLKHEGLGVCQQVDHSARAARAVNTLVKRDDGWHGYNTDGTGLMLDLQRLRLHPGGKRILVIGAGGAVAGILGPMLAMHPALVVILNRTGARAQTLAEKFAHRGVVIGGGFDQAADLEGFDLLIQATSSGHGQDLPPLDRKWLKDEAAGYDLNYGPAHRGFAQWCADHGLPEHDGLGMLVGQAALAFEIWTGRQPDMDPVLADLRAAQATP